MTEILNGHSEPTLLPFQQNGGGHLLDDPCPPKSNPPKPPRKKVSFHEAVTDILDTTLPPQNDDDEDEDDDFSLDSILNVSEKINFFSTIAATKEEKQPSSIPQARLAFVTGMVDGPSCETTSTPAQDCPAAAAVDTEMAGVTFAKIFASSTGKGDVDAVVDTSSILEHREELRELWEKRMMADDNQSSPPSVAVEKTEEGHEEAVVTTTKTTIISESETPIAKLTNGDCNGHVATPQEVESQDQDSLEANHVEEYVEEKTYTSETSFVMMNKQPEEAPTPVEETKEEVVVETKSETVETKVVETVETKVEIVETKVENVETKVEATEVKVETAAAEVKDVPEEKIENTSQDVVPEETPVEAAVTVEKEATPAEEVEAQPEDKKEAEKESEKVVEAAAPEVTTKVTEETKAAPEPILQIEESKQDGDGFVTLEDCLPKVEDATETAHESVDPSQPALSNGHVEPAEANSLPPTPEPSDDKANHPEIEEFVKSGGVKRIIPGVQKTEQPYSTCTTETKIAMEIREMREREEELRIMREQAALSPAPSPLPPAHSPAPSIRSPSPKDQQGTPYRVSSVFGRGTPSPVEEKQPFKVAAKETAVEREIRLARDREEELRKQKGLPPREDDSYVKPSQVKSSQVRVFGKAGSNVKQAATAKIQLEIEEQTQREIALRETGSIQTISHERTDAKVAKLNTPPPPTTNGSSHPASNGHHVNGRSSPEKRPSAPRPASIFSQGVSMHKFIASKGAPRPAFAPPPPAAKTQQVIEGSVQQLKGVKRNVESKIQQEIMEMKMREEELKLLHMNANGNGNHNGDSMEHEMNQKNNILEYENGHDLNEEDISPRHNKLIAQWEQRIQKAES